MIIKKEKYGRLGNRLWQFAYLLAFAKEHNRIVSYPGFNDFADYFQGTIKNVFCSYPALPIHPPKFIRKFIYNSIPLLKRILLRLKFIGKMYKHIWVKPGQYFDLDSEKNVKILTNYHILTLEGWLIRGNTTIIKHKKFIQSFFEPINKYRKPIHKLHKSISDEHNLIIGLYIRRGEPQHRYENYYYSFQEYKKVLNNLNFLFKEYKPGFILTSDESIPKNVFNNFPVYYTSENPIEDLYALCICDYICGISSTFGLWASFWGNVPLYMIENIDYKITIDSFKVYKYLD